MAIFNSYVKLPADIWDDLFGNFWGFHGPKMTWTMTQMRLPKSVTGDPIDMQKWMFKSRYSQCGVITTFRSFFLG